MKLQGIVFLTMAVVLVAGDAMEDCLEKDSISCMQKMIYRKAKEFFGKDNLEIISGVSLVKSDDEQARSARFGKSIMYDQEVDSAADVTDRQNAIESFVSEKAREFFTGRSLRINFAPAFEKVTESARAIGESMPEEIRQVVDEVTEGRGKKFSIKKILPLLIGAVAKIGGLATIAYFFVGLLAKKAIIASLISLAVSAFVGLKALWASKGAHDYTGYNKAGWNSGWAAGGGVPLGNAGWSSGSSGGWVDHHDYAQSQAYGGYHH